MHTSVFGDFANEKVEQVYLERLRRMTIEQRWRIVCEMREVAVNMVRSEVRREYPDLDERQVKLEATRRIMKAHGVTFRANSRPAKSS